VRLEFLQLFLGCNRFLRERPENESDGNGKKNDGKSKILCGSGIVEKYQRIKKGMNEKCVK
jgi:hypothetical protein